MFGCLSMMFDVVKAWYASAVSQPFSVANNVYRRNRLKTDKPVSLK